MIKRIPYIAGAIILAASTSASGRVSDDPNRTCVGYSGERAGGKCARYLPDLHEAAYRGNAELFRKRLSAGDDVNAVSGDYESPAIWAVRGGHSEILADLLAKGAIFAGSSRTASGVDFALRELCGSVAAVLKGGPLMPEPASRQAQRLQIVNMLLAVDPDAVRRSYIAPCVQNGQGQVALHLLSKGAAVNAVPPVRLQHGVSTALAFAYDRGDSKLVTDLLAAGALCSSADVMHSLLLTTWTMEIRIPPGRRKYVQDCIARGTSLSEKELGRRKKQAYMGALRALIPEAVALFLKSKLVLPNESMNSRGDTALHLVVAVGDFPGGPKANFPLGQSAGAELYHFPGSNGVPWLEAAESTIVVLRQFGADPKASNNMDRSSVDVAGRVNHALVRALTR